MRLATLLSIFLAAGAYAAQPRAFSVSTESGRVLDSAQLVGKAYLLWYEGPHTVELNDDAKEKLTAVMQALPEGRRVELVAVGDVSGYDYWPARAFAKKQLRKYEAKYGHPIYGDWQGAMRSSFGLPKDQSNLLFVDASGTVRFAATGKLAPAQVEQVSALLRGGK